VQAIDDCPRLPNVNVEKNYLESFQIVVLSLPVQKKMYDGMLRNVQISKKIIIYFIVLKYNVMPNPRSSERSDLQQHLFEQNQPRWDPLQQTGNLLYLMSFVTTIFLFQSFVLI
jgi:hypothetical protein